MSIYKNTKRLNVNGSQKETPKISCSDNLCKIVGYQIYHITDKNIINIGKYQGKFNYLKHYLRKMNNDGYKSFTDIGCSNGLAAFIALYEKYDEVYALDHDLECINLINSVIQHLGLNGITAKPYSFGEPQKATDIVFMGALIHWIYSCTGLYGNFKDIAKYLKTICNKYLLIEWVSPLDPAIAGFKHTDYNKKIIKEPYNKENFISGFSKHFKEIKSIYKVTGTREIFECTR